MKYRFLFTVHGLYSLPAITDCGMVARRWGTEWTGPMAIVDNGIVACVCVLTDCKINNRPKAEDNYWTWHLSCFVQVDTHIEVDAGNDWLRLDVTRMEPAFLPVAVCEQVDGALLGMGIENLMNTRQARLEGHQVPPLRYLLPSGTVLDCCEHCGDVIAPLRLPSGIKLWVNRPAKGEARATMHVCAGVAEPQLLESDGN